VPDVSAVMLHPYLAGSHFHPEVLEVQSAKQGIVSSLGLAKPVVKRSKAEVINVRLRLKVAKIGHGLLIWRGD